MLGTRLKSLRKESGLTQLALANKLDVTQQAVAKWESGKAMPSAKDLRLIALCLGVSADYILSGDESFPFMKFGARPVRVLGAVSAGYGHDAVEENLGCEPANVRNPDDYFYLNVKGDSMEPYIHNGDLALVRRQATLEDGEVGVIVYGEGEGTLKQFFKNGGKVLLKPFNEAYETLVVPADELQNLRIAGKLVETKTRW